MKTYAIVGTKHRGERAITLLASLLDGEPVVLIRDPGNPFDRKAVGIWAKGELIGFVPAAQNANLAERMDSAAKPQVDGTLRRRVGKPVSVDVDDSIFVNATPGRPV